MTTINATIVGNTASAGGQGGGINATGGTVTLFNTIVAANKQGASTPDDIFSPGGGNVSASSAGNLVGAGGSGGLTDGTNGNQVGVALANLHLGSLADNGGPLATIALLAGSPAIDAGNNAIAGVPSTDERGAERGPGGINAGLSVDVGAFEASSSYLVTSVADVLGYGTLRSAVSWANVSFNDNSENLPNSASNPNGNPQPNTVVFDQSGVFSSPKTITLTEGPLVFSGQTTPEAITGTGVGSLTISGGQQSQVFQVNSGVTVSLADLTIAQAQRHQRRRRLEQATCRSATSHSRATAPSPTAVPSTIRPAAPFRSITRPLAATPPLARAAQ